jgi:hypothetical protein
METAEEDVEAITNIPRVENFGIRNSQITIYQKTIVPIPNGIFSSSSSTTIFKDLQTRNRLCSHLEDYCYQYTLEAGNISVSTVDALLAPDRLGAFAVKSKILGFLQGVTGTISGHLARGRNGKKTAPIKVVRTRKRSTVKTRTAKKLKTTRVRAQTSRKTSPRKKLNPVPTLIENPTPAPTAQTTVYSCPACGLEADKALMLEHLLGSPLHQPGRVQPEQLTDRKALEQTTLSGEEDSSDSLRNLLQILLPPRPFGRRHEQKAVKL